MRASSIFRSALALALPPALAALFASPAHAALPSGTRLPATPIAAGALHAYQLQGGKLKGFGYDGDGRMGIGWTWNSRLTPQEVPGISDVVQVVVGNMHTLALKKDGTVWSWGYNNHGQLGNGTTTWGNTPAKVPGLSGIKKLAARDMNSYALASDGKVYAWGANSSGQIGIGTYVDALTPTRVAGGLPAVADIGAGSQHVIVADTTGAVWVWGANSNGQLGDFTTTSQVLPEKLTSLSGIKQVAAGGNFSAAVNGTGQVWSWGYGPATGTGSNGDRLVPIKITKLPDVNMIVAGASHALVLRKNAEVWNWGANNLGQQGYAGGTRLAPGKVNLPPAATIGAGDNNTFVTTASGEVLSWGANNNGTLGLGFSSSFEVTAQKAPAVRFPYVVLFVPVGTYTTAEIDKYKADATRLAIDISRLSYGQLQLTFEYADPFPATSQQAGCTSADTDARQVFVYAINRAIAAGYDLSRYGTIVSGWGSNVASGCRDLGNNWAYATVPTAPTNPLASIYQTTAVQLGTGLRWMGRGTRDNLEIVYGFLLGFGTQTATNPLTLNSSVSRLRCDGTVVPSHLTCALDSLSFRGMYSMAAPLPTDPNQWPWTHSNDTLGMKLRFGWLGSSDVTVVSSACTTRLSIVPLEATSRPPNSTYGAKISFPIPPNDATFEYSLFIEYRNDVRIGTNFANKPGVYATFLDNIPSLLQVERDNANVGSDAPLRLGTTYSLAGDYKAVVNAVGPDASGVDRADVTITNTSAGCL